MKLAAFIIAMLALPAMAEFSVDLWPLADHPEVNIYTPRIPNEYLTNVLYRSYSVNSSWYETNAVLGTNAPIATNFYGRYIVGGVTQGVVRANRDSFERVTDQEETILPLFSLPYYTVDPDYSFDAWFGLTDYPQDFPHASKADAFHKIGLGGLLVISNAVPQLTFSTHRGYATNLWGQVTNSVGYWTKRKNRVNPLIVAQWGPESLGAPIGGWFSPFPVNSYPNTAGAGFIFPASSEYCGQYNFGTTNPPWGESRLIDLSPDQYPVFRWIAGGSNAFVNLTHTADDDHDSDGNPGGLVWSNNLLYDVEAFLGEQQILSSPTTRANRAWITTRTTLTGPPANTNDHVQLVWTNPVTTYEGTKAWDNVFLREQFDEHHVFLTNLFLTPKPISGWTDGTAYYYTNNYDCRTNTVFTNVFESGSVTSDVCPTVASLGFDWWRGLPFTPPKWLAMTQDTEACSVSEVVYASGLSAAPSMSWNTAFDIDLKEEFKAIAGFNPPLPEGTTAFTNTTVWNWTASRTDEFSIVHTGDAVVSSPYLSGLWEGGEHRAHFYLRDLREGNYKRIEITPWTYDPVIVGSPIDLRSNYVDSIVLDTNAMSGFSQEHAYIEWERYYLGTTDLVTTLYGEVPTNVWAGSTNYVTNTYQCAEAETVIVSDYSDSNPNAWGTYTNDGDGIYFHNSGNGWSGGWDELWSYFSSGDDEYYQGDPPAELIGTGGVETGLVTVTHYDSPVFTNVITEVRYTSTQSVSTQKIDWTTNTCDIYGWRGYYLTNGSPAYLEWYIDDFILVPFNYPEATNTPALLPGVVVTNYTTNSVSAPCSGILTNLIEYYYATAFTGNVNQHAEGFIPQTTDFPAFLDICTTNHAVDSWAWDTNSVWTFPGTNHYADIPITFDLHKPCGTWQGIVSAWQYDMNREWGATNFNRSAEAEVKAMVEWRYP